MVISVSTGIGVIAQVVGLYFQRFTAASSFIESLTGGLNHCGILHAAICFDNGENCDTPFLALLTG